ncbi:MAG: hypothetical protein HQ579_05805 [Candidatus Omnitrophica bacterium]|nr:hypothetical protein [Candidatus Omnitrophota bacterium]
MSRIITALDLGSSNIRACAASINGRGQLKLLALERMPSSGISHGGVVDFDAATNDILRMTKALEKKAKKKIRYISLAISDADFNGFIANGMIALSARPRPIQMRDIVRCEKIAGFVQVPIDRQVVQKELHSFFINDGEKVRNPLGLNATKLSLNLYVVTGEASKLVNLQNVVEHAGYILDDMVFSGYATAHSIFANAQTEEKTALLDIGSHVTNITIIEEGALKYINSIQKGAEMMDSKSSMVPFFKEVKALFTTSPLSRVVVTGGGVLKEGFLEIAEKCLGVQCEMGQVRLNWCSLNLADTLLHTASLGLIAYKAKKLSREPWQLDPVKRPFRFLANMIDSYF